MFVVAAFYSFTPLPDFQALQPVFKQAMKEIGIKGSVLLAHEGINGTIAGTREAVDAYMHVLKREARLHSLEEYKESFHETIPFTRGKVRLKKEIIPMGMVLSSDAPRGTHVEPEAWNALISMPDTLVLDTRNDYEVHIGSFKNAVNPGIKSFKELAEYTDAHVDPKKNPKVAMFCTGGIRCEKFSSYLLQKGFKEVYQLQGGILKYLERVPEEKSLWEGSCFVFDHRVGVEHGVKRSEDITMCFCGHALKPEDRASEQYIENKQCSFCAEERI